MPMLVGHFLMDLPKGPFSHGEAQFLLQLPHMASESMDQTA